MKNKIYIIGICLLVFSISFVLGFGYTNFNGSEVFYDDSGKIIGVSDDVLKQSRYPNAEEVKGNDYVPMSHENTLKECTLN